jgi:hypothetical protein
MSLSSRISIYSGSVSIRALFDIGTNLCLIFRCADINECRTMPGLCNNGGQCLNTYGSFSCFCKTGFYGETCQQFDPCLSVTCVNGGTCLANHTYPYWQCACPQSYTGRTSNIEIHSYTFRDMCLGTHCEQQILSCSSNPCRTGTCHNLPNGQYQCMCPSSITGVNCDVALLPCDSNPCWNNSTCLSLTLNNYTCVCPSSHTGVNCAEERVLCKQNPCQSNGTCVVDTSTGDERCQCLHDHYGHK